MVHQSDFISRYEDYLSTTESPRLFRTWGAVACVAGALERRTWVHNRKASISGMIFPTQCVFHIAPTGVGKAPSVKLCQHLWDSVEHLRLGTESMTAASFYDELNSCMKNLPNGDIGCPFLIATEEISSFFIQYDHQMLGVMLKALDCSKRITQSRRGLKGKTVDIPFPSLTALFAGQPTQFNDKFPEAAYGLGFMGRSHIVYSEEHLIVPFFNGEEDRDSPALRRLESDINDIAGLEGEMTISLSAARWIDKQHRDKGLITAPHPRLTGYYERRPVHMVKIAMAKAAARLSMVIEQEDFNWALDLMERTEPDAQKAFQMFRNDNDSLVMREFLIYLRDRGKKTITQPQVVQYFADKLAHVQIPIMLNTLVLGEYLIPHPNNKVLFSIPSVDPNPPGDKVIPLKTTGA